MGKQFGSALDIPILAADPASPAAGFVSLYSKGGQLWQKDSAGLATPILPGACHSWRNKTADQTLVTGVFDMVGFNNFVSGSLITYTAPYFTLPFPGKYLVEVTLQYEGAATPGTRRDMRLQQGGTPGVLNTGTSMNYVRNTPTASTHLLNMVTIVRTAIANDTIQIEAFHNASTNIALTTAVSHYNHCFITYLGP